MEQFVLECGADNGGGEFFRDGWADPERDFRWMVGLESVLTLPRPPAAARYRLSLSVAPHVRRGKLPRQALICLLNDVFVGLAELTDEADLDWEVPRFAFEIDDAVTLRFIHPQAASPREIADIADDRKLAVAVRRLKLCSFTITKQAADALPDPASPSAGAAPLGRPSSTSPLSFHRPRGQPPSRSIPG